ERERDAVDRVDVAGPEAAERQAHAGDAKADDQIVDRQQRQRRVHEAALITGSAKWHAAMRSLSSGRSSGWRSRHSAAARGQRGWKRQPSGKAVAAGGWPGMAGNSAAALAAPGWHFSSASV